MSKKRLRQPFSLSGGDLLEDRMLLTASPWMSLPDAPLAATYDGEAPADLAILTSEFATASATSSTADASTPASVSGIPRLQSRPGAPVTILLDFDGHFESLWGNVPNLNRPAFDRDGNPGVIGAEEQHAIELAFQVVAEDFAPFDVNVATFETGAPEDRTLRVVVGGSSFYGSRVVGVGYLNSFSNSLTNTVLVFSDGVTYAHELGIELGDIASHEAGHSLGLEHQSVYEGGELKNPYNPGDATWAPIMGHGSDTKRITFHNGTAEDGMLQDDLAIITRAVNGISYRADDHANSASRATPLKPAGGLLRGEGNLETHTDVDVFNFSAGRGDITVSVNPKYALPISNLDGRFVVRASNGQIVASGVVGANPVVFTSTGLDQYTVEVSSSGQYGSAGHYVVEATATPVTATLLDGLLSITGTAADDQIRVRQGATLTVEAFGVQIAAFDPAQVQRIVAHGLAGNDLLNFAAVDKVLELYGEEGDDRLVGGRRADFLDGGRGNDLLLGGGGADVIRGGAGADQLQGGRGDDQINAKDGRNTDVIKVPAGSTDVIKKDAGDKVVSGNGGNTNDAGKKSSSATADAQAAAAAAIQQATDSLNVAAAKVAAATDELAARKAQRAGVRAEFDKAQANLDSARQRVDALDQRYDTLTDKVKAARKALDDAPRKLKADRQADLDNLLHKREVVVNEREDARNVRAQARSLADQWQLQLDAARARVDAADQSLDTAQKQFASAQTQLANLRKNA